jgi:hypothetical protein
LRANPHYYSERITALGWDAADRGSTWSPPRSR